MSTFKGGIVGHNDLLFWGRDGRGSGIVETEGETVILCHVVTSRSSRSQTFKREGEREREMLLSLYNRIARNGCGWALRSAAMTLVISG